MVGYEGASKMQNTLRSIRSELQVPPSQPLPVGAGFIGWVVEDSKEDILSVILPEHPKAVWFAFGRDMGKLVKKVHDHNETHGTKILVFLQATSMEEALLAANEWKVDVLVVQGLSR
jgi:nitronate monooxygenase